MVSARSNPAAASNVLQPVKKRLWYAIAFFVAALVLAVSAYLAYERPVMAWEESFFFLINNWPDSWRSAFGTLTVLGSTWAAAAAVVAAFVLRLYWLAWRLAVSIFAAYGIVYVLKQIVDRARPEFLFDAVNVRVAETNAGFPSGHSALIAVVMLTVMPYLPKVWRWIIALSTILVITLSRIYLGAHVPLDVIGGVAIGVVVVCFIKLLPTRTSKFFRLS